MISKKVKIPSLVISCVIATLFVSSDATALSISPTEAEWATWPDYCRARYVVSGAGKGTKFERRVSPAEVSRQEAKIGDEAWYWLHHHCAALIYLSRGKSAADDQRAAYWFSEAEANVLGQYERVSKRNPMFPDVVILIAQLYLERGEPETALRYLNESIEVQPSASSPYALAAIIHKDAGNLQKALEVLLEGSAALDEQSAELHYFLGHLYIDLDDLDSAAVHAERAYELGYPLPGLAAKLRRLGRSTD